MMAPQINENKQYLVGTKAVAGYNTLIAAPGVSRHIVVHRFIIQNEGATAVTAQLCDYLSPHWRALLQNQGDALVMDFPVDDLWWLGLNSPLQLHLSAAISVGYSIEFEYA